MLQIPFYRQTASAQGLRSCCLISGRKGTCHFRSPESVCIEVWTFRWGRGACLSGGFEAGRRDTGAVDGASSPRSIQRSCRGTARSAGQPRGYQSAAAGRSMPACTHHHRVRSAYMTRAGVAAAIEDRKMSAEEVYAACNVLCTGTALQGTVAQIRYQCPYSAV